MTVDLAALFAELAESQQGAGSDGYSVEEIAERLGKSPGAVRKLIRKALGNGSCEVVQRSVKTISGHWTRKAAFIFKAQKVGK